MTLNRKVLEKQPFNLAQPWQLINRFADAMEYGIIIYYPAMSATTNPSSTMFFS